MLPMKMLLKKKMLLSIVMNSMRLTMILMHTRIVKLLKPLLRKLKLLPMPMKIQTQPRLSIPTMLRMSTKTSSQMASAAHCRSSVTKACQTGLKSALKRTLSPWPKIGAPTSRTLTLSVEMIQKTRCLTSATPGKIPA